MAQIVKSLIFKTKHTNEPVLVLASGVNKVNERTIGSLVHEVITKASAQFVRECTGYSIGGIPPIGHKQPIPYIFIDEMLLEHDNVWAAAGTPNAVFEIKADHLESLTKGKVVTIV